MLFTKNNLMRGYRNQDTINKLFHLKLNVSQSLCFESSN